VENPPLMHVTEVARDQFQERCDGCVTRSIGYVSLKIKADDGLIS